MAGYSARQSSYSDGDVITAAQSNSEFDALVSAFNVSSGHSHDGSTAGDGGPITKLFGNSLIFGDGTTDQDITVAFNANGNDGEFKWMEDEDYFEFSDDILIASTEKLQFRDTAIYINSSADGQLDLVADTEIQIAATTIDMNGNVDVSGTLTYGSLSDGAITITAFVDEDNMASNSATLVPTQQSVKAYVDTQLTAEDLDFQADSGGALSIDLDSETLTFTGGTGIDTSGSGNAVTFAIDSTVATLAGSQSLTNKTIDVDNNTVSNIEVDNLKSGVLDTDLSSVSGSDDTVASAKAIKTYVDAQVTAQDLDITTDSGTIAIDLDGETLTVSGGEGIDTSATGNAITIAGEDASTSNKGVASFSSDNFAVSSGAVTIKDGGVVTAELAADAVTGAKIADDAIDSEHYTDGSIDTAHIADSQITLAKMAANSVDSDQYVDGSVDNEHLAGSIADSKLSTISTANKISLTALDIDGGTDIGEAVADADLFIVDNGAGGTNRKVTASALKTYAGGSSASKGFATAMAIAL